MTNGLFITGKKAKQLVEKGAMLIDVRDPISFRDGTISGASNLSLRQLSIVQKQPKTTPVVIFGDPKDPATLNAAVNYVTTYGFNKVHALKSMEDWYK
jgi:rhodanese-related sulfurtransferase